MSPGWRLRRNPLAPGVPLEGTDTVEGLRTLERQRLAELLQQQAAGSNIGSGGNAVSGSRGSNGGWRRAFTRYRGPFIEQLTLEDMKQAPKSWAVFWRGSERAGAAAEAYSLPASLAVLHERTEENFATFLPNYLRLAAAVMLATFYLRPKALLGAAAVALSMYRSVGALLQRQRREQQAAAVAAAMRAPNGTRAAARPPADPNEQGVNALVAVSTWVLVAYTRCMPMLLLGAWGALVAVLAHCALRRAPSEYRHKGRQLLGYTWQQVLGREPVPDGSDPRALFRELGAACIEATLLQLRRGWLYSVRNNVIGGAHCVPRSGSGSPKTRDGAAHSGAVCFARGAPRLHDWPRRRCVRGSCLLRPSSWKGCGPTGCAAVPLCRPAEPGLAAHSGGAAGPSDLADGGGSSSAGAPVVDRRRLPKTPEWRAAISAAKKAAFQKRGGMPKEWRQALSQAASRRRWGLDVRYRMALSHAGRKIRRAPRTRCRLLPEVRQNMAAGQRRRRERERRARTAAAGGAGAAGAQAAQAAQQLSEDLAREKAVIELSRLRQVVFGWMSEFQAQHGRQPSVQETQERNPVVYRAFVRYVGLRDMLRGAAAVPSAGMVAQPPDARLRAEGLRGRRPEGQAPQAGSPGEEDV
ncbi:hypothetical protein ABPG77_008336 [Micractinium sp. CCAP 211/92]